MSSEDLDILKSLWENINDICVPPSPPGTPTKACFLMEMPGFAINPDAFDLSKFTVDQRSPDLAKANLCDRVPYIARCFYDTGNRISFLWKNFLRTFVIDPSQSPADKLRKRKYDEAIEALYGSREGLIQHEKTPLYESVDTLREEWEKAKEKEIQFRNECQKDTANWPENFDRGVGPYRSEVEEKHTEYNSVKEIVDKYEAAIHAYVSQDLTTVLEEQQSRMEQQILYDPGVYGTAFYKVILEPSDWWEWFKEEGTADDGWTEVIVRQEHKYQSLYNTYAGVSSFSDSTHGGLFYMGNASGGFARRSGNNLLTTTQSQIRMTFKIRKVFINRPWLTPAILNYPTLGIQGQKVGSWSSGVLDKTNNGVFPLLPTAFVVAKDVTVSSNMYSDVAEKALSKISTHSYVRVGVGPFATNGNFSSVSGSKPTTSKYDETKKTLTINGAQIVGWVCAVNPYFPQYSAENKQPSKNPNFPDYENQNVIDYSAPTQFSAPAQPSTRSYGAPAYGSPAYGAPPYPDPAQFGMPPHFKMPTQFGATPQLDPRSYMKF